MRDPQVTRLHYDIGSGPDISYRDPPPVAFTNELGAFSLHAECLTIDLVEHFPTQSEARAAVEPFLRGWEIEADLTGHFGAIRFKFAKADVVDRDPPKPGEPRTIHVGVASTIAVAGNITVQIGLRKYPEPPSAFRSTPEVELAYRRWIRFRDGKEPLPSMAYFILSLLEAAAGDRNNATATFRIDRRVLNELGRLASTRGDGHSARKIRAGQQLGALTSSETEWMQQAVRLLVRRLGEHASGAPLKQISMTDLPPS